MASIARRGNLQWRVRVRIKGYPVQTRTFETRNDAEAWAKITESEMVRGVFISRKEAENTSLAEALERYEREVSSRKKGYGREKTRIKNWMGHDLAKRSLASIRGSDMAHYRDTRINSGYASNTVRLEPGYPLPSLRNRPERMGNGRSRQSGQVDPDAFPSRRSGPEAQNGGVGKTPRKYYGRNGENHPFCSGNRDETLGDRRNDLGKCRSQKTGGHTFRNKKRNQANRSTLPGIPSDTLRDPPKDRRKGVGGCSRHDLSRFRPSLP